METLIIKQDSPEYNFMWDWVAKHPINEGLENPMEALNDGEVWQYMGSSRLNNHTLHSFRHRFHPKNNEKVDLIFAASPNLNKEDIEGVYKVK